MFIAIAKFILMTKYASNPPSDRLSGRCLCVVKHTTQLMIKLDDWRQHKKNSVLLYHRKLLHNY